MRQEAGPHHETFGQGSGGILKNKLK